MNVPEKIKHKLQILPDKPGCYLMRDAFGHIIYVGKASSLRRRVRSYFRQAAIRRSDPKLLSLIHSAADLDIIVLKSEAEAILTEGQLIKDYRPRYNILFKDDKRFLLLRVDLNQPFPQFTACRFERPDSAVYFGPYASSAAAWMALEFVEKRFGLRKCSPLRPGVEEHRHCINDIVRFCSAPCIGKISPEDYRRRVELACAFLRGEQPETFKELETDMNTRAKAMKFEEAAAIRDMLRLLKIAVRQRAYVARRPPRLEDAQEGLAQLGGLLHLKTPPAVIEAFDVSTISGTFAVASMVCAVEGVPCPKRYRRFRIKTVSGTDDPAMMAEVIRRRYSRLKAEQKPLPDLVLADGGVTQLGAARTELDRLELFRVPAAGLAKRLEEIYPEGATRPIFLPADSPALKVLQRLRDEAHRFALTYHRHLREQRIRESLLDDIPGVGEKRKQQLLRRFGSIARLRRAAEADIAGLPGFSAGLASLIKSALSRSP